MADTERPPIPEDYAAIRAAMAQHGLERNLPTDRACTFCKGLGWQNHAYGFMTPEYRVCANCGNPKGLPRP